MKTVLTFISTIIVALVLLSCIKHKTENWKTLKKLYANFKNGSIEECKLKGERVYVGVLNAYDAGSEIYDKEYNVIGNCNYAWGKVDTICKQLEDCEVIYRVENNIWGEPAVNKYKLGK